MLVKEEIVNQWYDINHPIYKNFLFFWTKILRKGEPRGFSVCPFFWMAVVGFCLRPVYHGFVNYIWPLCQTCAIPFAELDKQIGERFEGPSANKGSGILITVVALLASALLGVLTIAFAPILTGWYLAADAAVNNGFAFTLFFGGIAGVLSLCMSAFGKATGKFNASSPFWIWTAGMIIFLFLFGFELIANWAAIAATEWFNWIVVAIGWTFSGILWCFSWLFKSIGYLFVGGLKFLVWAPYGPWWAFWWLPFVGLLVLFIGLGWVLSRKEFDKAIGKSGKQVGYSAAWQGFFDVLAMKAKVPDWGYGLEERLSKITEIGMPSEMQQVSYHNALFRASNRLRIQVIEAMTKEVAENLKNVPLPRIRGIFKDGDIGAAFQKVIADLKGRANIDQKYITQLESIHGVSFWEKWSEQACGAEAKKILREELKTGLEFLRLANERKAKWESSGAYKVLDAIGSVAEGFVNMIVSVAAACWNFGLKWAGKGWRLFLGFLTWLWIVIKSKKQGACPYKTFTKNGKAIEVPKDLEEQVVSAEPEKWPRPPEAKETKKKTVKKKALKKTARKKVARKTAKEQPKKQTKRVTKKNIKRNTKKQ